MKHEQKPLDKKPLLTVVVPAYNCAEFLKKGVLSLVNHGLNNLVEVLIVNDGSKDDTLAVAEGLRKLSPSVRVIDKANGGHGSTINVGIKRASGKYFRLMDGDDYFDTKEFVRFLEKLQKEEADIILTDYTEDLIKEKRLNSVHRYDNLPKNQSLQIENMMDKKIGFKTWGPLLSTTTCKTALLKTADFKIDENCFYVDMEYNFMVYAQAETLIYYPLDIYRYVVGLEEQSVNAKNMRKNYQQHEKVCLRLLQEYEARKAGFGAGKNEYLKERLVTGMCDSNYYVILHYLRSRKKFLEFDHKLKKYPKFYDSPKIAGKVVRALRITNGRGLKVIVALNEFLNKK